MIILPLNPQKMDVCGGKMSSKENEYIIYEQCPEVLEVYRPYNGCAYVFDLKGQKWQPIEGESDPKSDSFLLYNKNKGYTCFMTDINGKKWTRNQCWLKKPDVAFQRETPFQLLDNAMSRDSINHSLKYDAVYFQTAKDSFARYQPTKAPQNSPSKRKLIEVEEDVQKIEEKMNKMEPSELEEWTKGYFKQASNRIAETRKRLKVEEDDRSRIVDYYNLLTRRNQDFMIKKIEGLPLICKEMIYEMIFKEEIFNCLFLILDNQLVIENLKHLLEHLSKYREIFSLRFFNHILADKGQLSATTKKTFFDFYFSQYNIFFRKYFDFNSCQEFGGTFKNENHFFIPFEYGVANSMLIAGRGIEFYRRILRIDKTKFDLFLNKVKQNDKIKILESKIIFENAELRNDRSTYFWYSDDKDNFKEFQYNPFMRKLTLVCKIEDVEEISPKELDNYVDSIRLDFKKPLNFRDYENKTDIWFKASNPIAQGIVLAQDICKRKYKFKHFSDVFKTGVLINGVPLIAYKIPIKTNGYIQTWIYCPLHYELFHDELGYKKLTDFDLKKFLFRNIFSKFEIKCALVSYSKEHNNLGFAGLNLSLYDFSKLYIKSDIFEGDEDYDVWI